MGLFGSRKKKPEPKKQSLAAPVVTVSFREPSLSALDGSVLRNIDPDYGYSYIWPFNVAPQVGMWAIAPGMDGPATVVVVALGRSKGSRGISLKPLISLIPHAQLVSTVVEPWNKWLDVGRAAAGLPALRRGKLSMPAGFDAFPPAVASPVPEEIANANGRVWRRASNVATQLGRDPQEIARFEEIAQQWYKIRNLAQKAEKAQLMNAAAEVHRQLGADGIAAAARTKDIVEIESLALAGVGMPDWLEYVKSITKDNPDDALAIAHALIDRAEQVGVSWGTEPPPAYTERAAIIHRAQKDYAGEIEVIQRWIKAWPEDKRPSGAHYTKLKQRQQKARELKSKTK